MDAIILRVHANQRMLEARKGSKAWFFWRGVLLGIENGESKLVTLDWADAVCKQKGGKRSAK